MARFLKQSFAQTCLKEMDNGKLQRFNYSRTLITNRGTVERGIGCIVFELSGPKLVPIPNIYISASLHVSKLFFRVSK